MKRYFKAKIKNGKFYSDKQKFDAGVANMPDGDYVHLLIKVSDRTPRESQNYYFVQIGEWANSVGYSKEDLHELVKDELFVELFDEPRSTSDLTKEDWMIVFLNLETFLISKFENR